MSLRHFFNFGLIIGIILIASGCKFGDNPNTEHTGAELASGDSLLNVEVFKIGKKEVKVDSPAEWLKLQEVVNRRLENKATQDESEQSWSSVALYKLRNPGVSLSSKLPSMTTRIVGSDGKTVAKRKVYFTFDKAKFEVNKIQPDFGAGHVRSVRALEIGKTYRLHMRKPSLRVLKIKPIRYWLVPNGPGFDIALEYLVLDGSDAWEGGHKVDYMTYLGLLPYKNGSWNDAAWIEAV